MVAQRVTVAERRLATAGDEDRAGDDDGGEVTVDGGGSIIDIVDQLSCLRDPKCGIDAAAGLDSSGHWRAVFSVGGTVADGGARVNERTKEPGPRLLSRGGVAAGRVLGVVIALADRAEAHGDPDLFHAAQAVVLPVLEVDERGDG
jgi:hypothetical protein